VQKFERPSAGYSITLRLKIENRPGAFARVCELFGKLGASLAEVTLVESDFAFTVRDVTVSCRNEDHIKEVISSINDSGTAELLSQADDTFELHRGGKITVDSRSAIQNRDQLSRAYTPGVARVCMHIHDTPQEAFTYTIKGNCVAVVSDGTAVLGLGDIGPRGAIPVMEGKAMLFKQFAGINGFPICLDTQDTEEIISVVKSIAPVFGGINLEDISAPRCFEIEERLRSELDIPVFHDDQHGTAVVVLAGVLNALKIVGKKIQDLKVVVNGFGASGVACTKMLLSAGVRNIIPCDTAGSIYRGRTERMNPIKEKLVAVTNPENFKGSVREALRGADMFLGVSSPGAINRADVEAMNRDPIIFALANPTPEILPDEIEGVARIVATGRSDYANQVNNALCFPGIFRGALDARASDITDGMKLAAAMAIADAVSTNRLSEKCIIPGIFESGIADRVAKAVYAAAVKEGVARV
jgi:malate dehydrogenase (oxaloacetate-decarboxylating)